MPKRRIINHIKFIVIKIDNMKKKKKKVYFYKIGIERYLLEKILIVCQIQNFRQTCRSF